jgi:hypothetical protein
MMVFRFDVRGAATAPRVVLVCHLASVARQSLCCKRFADRQMVIAATETKNSDGGDSSLRMA